MTLEASGPLYAIPPYLRLGHAEDGRGITWEWRDLYGVIRARSLPL